MHDDGLIGAELYTALRQEISERRTQAERRPALDLALRKDELVRQFPLFADLDEAELRRLTGALRSRYVDAGKVIVRKDSAGRSVFFVASGAVEQEIAGQVTLLGRGDIFGQMAVLTQKPRRAEVTAITPTNLLELDEAGFRRVLKRSRALRQAVRDSISAKIAADETLRLPELDLD